MGLKDRRITAWENPIVNEADTPNRLPQDMKRVFDANSNQLKDSFNGAVDDIIAGEVEQEFEEVQVRENINSGENMNTIFGKIKKWFSDLLPVVQTVRTDQGTARFLRGDGVYAVPEAGEAANGMPAGGEAGELLVKTGKEDFAAGWESAEEIGVATLDANRKVDAEQASAAIHAQTASYTLTLSDAGRLVTVESDDACTVTIPDLDFPIGTEIEIVQMGAGVVTIAGNGVDVLSMDGMTDLAGQYAVACIKKINDSTWLLAGGLA